MIRVAATNDAEAIASIYNHYVVNTTITFEEQEVTVTQMAGRIAEVQSASLPWLVAEQSGEVLAYAYATKWKARSAYRFSVESTVYVKNGFARQGLGTKLYEGLVLNLKERGVHAVMGGIALPNESSIALHEKFGFKKVAHFQEVGFKFCRWLDVGYWQRVL